MFKILTLNNISPAGLEKFAHDKYEVASEFQAPDAILLRSFKMHDMEIPSCLKAVGRAGAGVNNIPVDKLSSLGIPVFNAPGANANAVKELVLAGLLIASRNICFAWEYSKNLTGVDSAISKQVEAGKKKYVGNELPGKTLGVVGLGAIGVKIANAAHELGMRVIGFDPQMTVSSAWKLNANVEASDNIESLLQVVDYVTFHVPLIEATKNMINAERLANMKDGVVILNFAREGIIDEDAVISALDSGKVRTYITDFPNNKNIQHQNIVTLPHLGASTNEAEDNCAIMVAKQIQDFLENGNIVNSVNFPKVKLSRTSDFRLVVANKNVPNMIGQISSVLAESDINIIDLLNKSKGDIAYNLFDIDCEPTDETMDKIRKIEGVLVARKIT